MHTSVCWVFSPCTHISKLSNPEGSMATPSSRLLESTVQEPSLTPVFLSTLDSGSIRKSYQLSFQTRQGSGHLPPLLTLVQTIICQAGYTRPPCLWPCRAYTLSQCSRHSTLPMASAHITQSKGPTGTGWHTPRPLTLLLATLYPTASGPLH